MSGSEQPGELFVLGFLHLGNGLDMSERGDYQESWKWNKRILVNAKILRSLDEISRNQHGSAADRTAHAFDIPFIPKEVSGFHIKNLGHQWFSYFV